jgi:hypothetical protein
MSTDDEYHASTTGMTGMYKNLILTLSFIGLLAAGLFVYLRGDRYSLVAQAGDDGKVYKIDRRTGRVWLIDYAFSVEIKEADDKSPETQEESAIGLAKSYFPPDTPSSMDDTIHNWLRAKEGTLRVYGWKARKVDNQTYLVGYTFDEGPGTNVGGWVFEVNLEAGIVRKVQGDQELEKKYADWAQTVKKQ